jgi:hypothetical protein
LCAVSTGCADEPAGLGGSNGSVPQTTEQPGPGSRRTAEERAAAPVDVDLTVLSATVRSAEMMNMFTNAEDYLGRTIRVSGLYEYFYYEAIDSLFHYIITVEGDECCVEGIEFKWRGNHVFPDDYPHMRTVIEVDGVFSYSEEPGFRYYYLAVDDIFIVD